MKKLEDIPKNDIFKVPDGYFDNLPTIIQARVAKNESQWAYPVLLSLKYALPILVIGVALFWYWKSGTEALSTEQVLASINSDDLIEYIEEADMSTEDLLESIDYTKINADSLDLYESEVLIDDSDLEDILNEFKTEL